jgi:cysteine synthase
MNTTVDSVLEAIGNTPLIRLRRVVPPGGAEVAVRGVDPQPVVERVGVEGPHSQVERVGGPAGPGEQRRPRAH